eukprot:CAMPEP_0202830696 /NCGR_PEP_ID=MMETSP1389-20130828/16343_1 /ASSEMBLY_ACC=CAM_ASM_000865 /TAXON_ID=302021 /ORGANISM="Rhodomonas sp., Strain CCMP768" /LENGTH=66 /DNA_ID=CAMNT_0049504361 /DNA_START=96 /DNA_END=292 /DNA_ORIENTATION=-
MFASAVVIFILVGITIDCAESDRHCNRVRICSFALGAVAIPLSAYLGATTHYTQRAVARREVDPER